MKRNLVLGHYELDERYIRHWVETYFQYQCTKQTFFIRKLNRVCKHFLSIHQRKMKEDYKEMVKIKDLKGAPTRLDLNDLDPQMELRATGERQQAGTAGKAGGLLIDFLTRDNKKFTQKYTSTMTPKLVEACDKLGIEDTIELQAHWYAYELTKMGQWFPRMLPVKKLEKVVVKKQ